MEIQTVIFIKKRKYIFKLSETDLCPLWLSSSRCEQRLWPPGSLPKVPRKDLVQKVKPLYSLSLLLHLLRQKLWQIFQSTRSWQQKREIWLSSKVVYRENNEIELYFSYLWTNWFLLMEHYFILLFRFISCWNQMLWKLFNKKILSLKAW